MACRIRINGSGRIGRMVIRRSLEVPDVQVYIGIVDFITPQQIEHFPTSEKEAAFAWLNQ